MDLQSLLLYSIQFENSCSNQTFIPHLCLDQNTVLIKKQRLSPSICNLVCVTGPIRGKLCWNPIKMVTTAAQHLTEHQTEDCSGFTQEQAIFPRKTWSNTPDLACLGHTGDGLSLAWPSPLATAEVPHGNTSCHGFLSQLCQGLHALQPDGFISPQNVDN